MLTGACQQEHAGLVLLTSRFPFADLEQFDGGAARMMDVPPFTPAEGAAVLAAAGCPRPSGLTWCERWTGMRWQSARWPARWPTGHQADDLQVLRAELLAAGRTDTRVSKVLRFHADRLTEADRALVAVVGLFQRPVLVATALALGSHDTTGARLAGWTPAQVETAVRQRLSGLLSWHPGGTLSAHPLVRDAFRPLVLTGDSAQLAADTVLSDLPTGSVTSRDDALRVVEMIELLVDADEWQAADRLHDDRVGGRVLLHLPAAQLGQRCAAAFVGTPSRRSACRDKLGQDFGYYLNELGLMGKTAGNLTVAATYLNMAAEEARSRGSTTDLSTSLQYISELALHLGDTEAGIQAGVEACEAAAVTDDRHGIKDSYVDRAYCDRELGCCDLIEGDLDSAGRRLQAAADVLRDGEYLVEWAATLPDLAEHRRRTGQWDEAERLCTEAITAAGPRGLVPTHARALATRALIRGDQFGETGDRDQLDRARDDAEHALRLATRTRRLPWQELDAFQAHAHLDQLEARDHGWRIKAENLHVQLVPPGLDPDPLATVEARVRELRSTDG